MAIGSLVSRGTGFLRTVVIGAALGGSPIGNAYTTANILPGMVYELLLGGVLASVLIPVLVRAPQERRRTGGEAYAQRLLTLAVLALGRGDRAGGARRAAADRALRQRRDDRRRPRPGHDAVVPDAADDLLLPGWPR